MASLLEKVNTLISANLHALVNKALKANSIAVIDEYIRRAEDNLEALEDTAATVGGEAKTLQRKYEEYSAKIAELDHNIDFLLKEGKEDLAMAAQSRLNTFQELAEQYKEQAAQQAQEFQKLLDARLKLEAKINEIKQEREKLNAMLELAKSKETTHKVVAGVAGVTAEEAGIADMKDAIQRRLDQAAAQGEVDASRLDQQMDDLLEKDKLGRQLAERKKKLNLGA